MSALIAARNADLWAVHPFLSAIVPSVIMHQPLTGEVQNGLSMLSVGGWTAHRGVDAPPHRHAGWKITYYRTGRIDSVVDGIVHDVTPGTVLVLPPNAVHVEIATTAYSNYYLIVDATDAPPWPDACHGETAHEIGRLLGALLREDSAADQHSPAMTRALLTAVDVTLRRHHAGTRRGVAEEIVRATELLFEERFATSLMITDVAAEVGVSPSTLRHYFATTSTIPAQTMLRRIRLRHALTMLRTSDLPLAAIAHRCGFSSASHLSRDVTAETQQSPGRWRATTSVSGQAAGSVISADNASNVVLTSR